MEVADLSTSRAVAYLLLGRLFAGRLGPEELGWLRATSLGEHLPADDAAALEALAVAHHRLFGLGVFPWAGAFLAEDGQVGGPATEAALRVASRSGIPLPDTSEGPEHLGVLLTFMAQLCAAQEGPAAAHRLVDQRAALTALILPWLPALSIAVEREGPSLWSEAAGLALELCLDHLGSLPPSAPAEGADAGPTGGPSQEGLGLLDRPDTGLWEVAAFLAAPARCGLFLSRGHIAGIGARAGVPGAFGDRRGMIDALLRGAVDHGCLPPVLAELRGSARAWDAAFAGMGADAQPWVLPWRERLAALEGILDQLETSEAQTPGADAEAP